MNNRFEVPDWYRREWEEEKRIVTLMAQGFSRKRAEKIIKTSKEQEALKQEYKYEKLRKEAEEADKP